MVWRSAEAIFSREKQKYLPTRLVLVGFSAAIHDNLQLPKQVLSIQFASAILFFEILKAGVRRSRARQPNGAYAKE